MQDNNIDVLIPTEKEIKLSCGTFKIKKITIKQSRLLGKFFAEILGQTGAEGLSIQALAGLLDKFDEEQICRLLGIVLEVPKEECLKIANSTLEDFSNLYAEYLALNNFSRIFEKFKGDKQNFQQAVKVNL